MLGDLPIRHDFTPDEERIARAGYEAFHRDRVQSRSWDSLNPHEQFRWLLAGYIVATRAGTVDPVALRALYHIGTSQPAWSALTMRYRFRWGVAAGAMLQAREQLRAAGQSGVAA